MSHLEINKQLVQNSFKDILENINSTEEVYSHYFSTEYEQYVDGKKLNYHDFVAHIQTLKAHLESVKITFKHIIAEDDKVATVHIADAVKKNGTIVKAQINALFQIKANKIILCDELTYLISGEASDKDLGSRH